MSDSDSNADNSAVPDPTPGSPPDTTGSGSGSGPGDFVAPSVDDLNRRLPQFEFIDLLGVGGMGAVYKARQPKLNRFVAIKILPRIDDDEHGFAERFEREAQSMAQFSHPHIVPVYDFGETKDGQLYFVMEFVEGADLHQLISGGQLTLEHFFSWIPQVCSALEYAHRHGVVHRDIKPANILINLEGQVRIADFGLAKLTSADRQQTSLTHKNLSMGTPDYAAPEQIDADREVDSRVDIYALGVVMYQMLTGKVPRGAFRNPSDSNKGIDPRLDAVVLQAMQATPADRFQHATEISTRLHEIQTSSKQTAAAASGSKDASRPTLITGAQAVRAHARHHEEEAIPVAPLAPRSRAVPITIVAVLLIGLLAAIVFKLTSPDKREAGGRNSAAASATGQSPGKPKEKDKATGKPQKPKDKPKSPPQTSKPSKDRDNEPGLADAGKRPVSNGGDSPAQRPPGKPPGKMNGGGPGSGPGPGGGPDRRRRMFDNLGDNERKTVANLTIISRSPRPLEDSALAKIPPKLGEVARLAVGQVPGKVGNQTAFAIAQNTRGELFALGDNRHGQLDIPDAVRDAAADIVQLKAGAAHVVALDRSGKVFAWGRHEEGQCQVPETLGKVTQLVAGPMFSAALLGDGRVVTWGGGDALAVPPDLEPVSEIAAGEDNLMALHQDGTVTVWGADREAIANTPKAGKVIDIACAQRQHFALLEDGQLITWSRLGVHRPLPKVVAREIHGTHDTLAIRLDAGSWIFYGRDSRSTPMVTLPQRRYLRATVIEDLVFTWVFDPGRAPLLAGGNSADSPEVAPVVIPEPDPVLPPEAESAIAEVQQRFEELYFEGVEKPYADSVANLNEFYLKYLEADAGTAQANAQLDALIAIQAESERIGSGEAVPDTDGADTPAALVNRRTVYREQMEAFQSSRASGEAELNQQYLDKLDSMQAGFTREGKTGEALAVRAFRARFAASRAAESAIQDSDAE